MTYLNCQKKLQNERERDKFVVMVIKLEIYMATIFFLICLLFIVIVLFLFENFLSINCQNLSQSSVKFIRQLDCPDFKINDLSNVTSSMEVSCQLNCQICRKSTVKLSGHLTMKTFLSNTRQICRQLIVKPQVNHLSKL